MRLIFADPALDYLKCIRRAFQYTPGHATQMAVTYPIPPHILLSKLPTPGILLTPDYVTMPRTHGYARSTNLGNGYVHILGHLLPHQGPDGRPPAYWAFRAALQLLLKMDHANPRDFVIVAPFGDATAETAHAMHAAYVDVLVYPPYPLFDSMPHTTAASYVIDPYFLN
jgi:hypothetical protein